MLQNIKGHGRLIADGKEYPAMYAITVICDDSGNRRAAGTLQPYRSAMAASMSHRCSLRLDSGDEVPVEISIVSNRVSVKVSGAIPEA
jgi:hypothetical protein